MSIEILRFEIGHREIVGNRWSKGPSLADIFSILVHFKYTGPKAIKYVTFTFIPYNEVGDAMLCGQRTETEFKGRVVGPIEPNSKHVTEWENVWASKIIAYAKIVSAYIQYMDGSEETITLSSRADAGTVIGGNYTTSGGCYVATAIYGSYDCPQVWTLRRYRDYTLAKTWYGRMFIYIYYAISPTIVKWFGDTEWFKAMWRPKLDRMVASLNLKGIEDTHYEDKNW